MQTASYFAIGMRARLVICAVVDA